jgi:hypothetical protein
MSHTIHRTIAVLLGLLALALPAAAHRVDEYLQATRIEVAPDRIELDLALTPGIQVAPMLLAAVDTDRNGAISAAESSAYGAAVLDDVVLELDGRRLAPQLAAVGFPSLEDLRSGTGVIRIAARAPVGEVAPGRHRAFFRNQHRSDCGVYLVNALVPRTPGVAIESQDRDMEQRSTRLEFTVAAAGGRRGFGLPWILAGPVAFALAAAGVLGGFRLVPGRVVERKAP